MRIWKVQRAVSWQLNLILTVIRVIVLAAAGLGVASGRISPGDFLAASLYLTFALGFIYTNPRKVTPMSHTSPRPRRFSRFAAGLTVAAAATASTLLVAAPAYAQSSSVLVSVSGGDGTLNVSGTPFGDIITASGGNTVTLSNLTGTFTNVGGCVVSGQTATCNGVQSISFSGLGGNDKFDNLTSKRSNLSGQEGSDILLGGSANDLLGGGPGTDRADGRGGNDVCAAEIEISC
jgi:hypothetical protein